MRSALVTLARKPVVRKALTSVAQWGGMVDQFVAGETVEECVAVARQLRNEGRLSTIDVLGEDISSLSESAAVVAAYLELLQKLPETAHGGHVEVSVKPTAIGLALPGGDKIAFDHVSAICAAAEAARTTVTVDMEGPETVDDTLALVRRVRETYPKTGIVLQAYLKRTPADCTEMGRDGGRVRICKGAYVAPPGEGYKRRADVDDAYVDCVDALMSVGAYPMLASHDPKMVGRGSERALKYGYTPDRFEFQMLHGIRVDEQKRLAAAGFQMRTYLPYGADWYGYFSRRVAERPSMMLLVGRAFAGKVLQHH